MRLNPELRSFWKERARHMVLYGGRASSKSEDVAGMLTYMSSKVTIRVLCTRMFQNKLSDSVYSLIVKKIDELGLRSEFLINNGYIKHMGTGSEFLFYGLWRHIDEIKSLDAIDICFIEEAHNFTADQWRILNPTIRKQGSMFIIVFNPQLVTDFVWTRFVVNPPKDSVVKKINYTENRFLSDTMREVIEEAKEEDLEEYTHVYLGEPKSDDDDAIIKRAWIMSCIDAHITLDEDMTGGHRIGFDVADSGTDLNAVAVMDGAIVTDLESWKGKEDELFESSARVYGMAQELAATVNYDSNGVGAGVGSNMKQMNRLTEDEVSYYGFDSASIPANPSSLYIVNGAVTQQTNREYFENRKAQAWWMLADRIKATHRAVTKGDPYDDNMISISSEITDIDKLITELSTPRKMMSGRLKNIVEKKEDLKKRGIASPNLADALVMASYAYNIKDKTESLRVEL